MKHCLRKFAPVVSLSAFVMLNACRKADVPPAVATNPPTISSPVTLDLIPAQNQNPGDRRVYLPITRIGSTAMNLITVFDSGSEGLVLQGSAVFPAQYIADTGMVINSADSAIINGITVTSTKVVSVYGDPPATRSFYGNIAYAQVTFGDQNGSIQSERMPFVVIYKGIDNQTQDTVPLDASSNGIAGVYSTGFDPSVTLVTTRAGVKSPFNYFNYTGGLDAGIATAPFSQVGWTNTPSNTGFPATRLLTVGLTSDMEAGYAFQSQLLDAGNAFDPDVVGSFTYNGTTLSNSLILFDTGTPVGYTLYNGSAGGSSTLASGTSVQLTTQSGFSYAYTADNALFQTTVTSTGQQRCILGIDFFLNNSLLLDYTMHYIGLKGS